MKYSWHATIVILVWETMSDSINSSEPSRSTRKSGILACQCHSVWGVARYDWYENVRTLKKRRQRRPMSSFESGEKSHPLASISDTRQSGGGGGRRTDEGRQVVDTGQFCWGIITACRWWRCNACSSASGSGVDKKKWGCNGSELLSFGFCYTSRRATSCSALRRFGAIDLLRHRKAFVRWQTAHQAVTPSALRYRKKIKREHGIKKNYTNISILKNKQKHKREEKIIPEI